MSVFTRGIQEAARTSPHRLTAGTFSNPVALSWQEVHQLASRFAGGLSERGVGHGASVAVLATDAAAVVPLAQAVWLRGAAMTALQLPRARTDLSIWLADTVRAIDLIGADLVVVGEPFQSVRDQLPPHIRHVCSIEELRTHAPIVFDDDPDETTVALRQLTSGSTGAPKAVEISHGNLAASTIALHDAIDWIPVSDVLASWLPLSHDMGMIAFVCGPMQRGAEVVIFTAEEFLRAPLTWARMISKYRATITAGPSFAYSVLARLLKLQADTEGIDLSSLRVAVTGAEPIDHRDITEFVAAAAPFGMNANAPMPGYGLAEATLVATLGDLHDPPVIDVVSRAAVIGLQRADPSNGDVSDDEQHVVCVGSPVAGMGVRIVRSSNVLGLREIGTVELRGPTVATNYLVPDGVVQLTADGGWFDTGDLGYLDELGRLYICGRSKDVIILAGKNLHPHDIERAAETVAGVRKGCVVALRVDGEREGFAVVAEARGADDMEHVQISEEITIRVSRHIGHLPRYVLVVPAGTLPKTASGKLRRSSARDLLPKHPPVLRRPLSNGHGLDQRDG